MSDEELEESSQELSLDQRELDNEEIEEVIEEEEEVIPESEPPPIEDIPQLEKVVELPLHSKKLKGAMRRKKIPIVYNRIVKKIGETKVFFLYMICVFGPIGYFSYENFMYVSPYMKQGAMDSLTYFIGIMAALFLIYAKFYQLFITRCDSAGHLIFLLVFPVASTYGSQYYYNLEKIKLTKFDKWLDLYYYANDELAEGNQKSALDYFNQSVEHLDDLTNINQQNMWILSSMDQVKIYKAQKKSRKVLGKLLKIYKVMDKEPSNELLKIQAQIVSMYGEHKDYLNAFKWINLCQKTAGGVNSPHRLSVVLCGYYLGMVRINENDLDGGLVKIDDTFQYFKSYFSKNPSFSIIKLKEIANLTYLIEKKDKALEYNKAILDLVRNNPKYQDSRKEMYEKISQIYKEKDLLMKAKIYFDKAKELETK